MKHPIDPDRAQRRAELRRDVKLMRALGVFIWDGVTLGPEPAPPAKNLTPEELRERLDAQQEARERVMFASSSVRPRRVG
jgi:hypothetical protein